ncbi:MAG: insulinase family protein, partial [Candidatus Eremiobacteraeota bacterium]|nr:insulinase family protein [Candidatus Eremiobacteraeota bacterium]
VAAQDKLPATKAELAQRLALYAPGDPRRRDVTAATVAAVSLEDAKRYYRFAFRPDETAIAIVGDVTPVQVEAIISKYFGQWKAIGPAPTFTYPKLAHKITKAETVRVKSTQSQQSEVTLKQTFKMYRGDADFVPLLMANIILSGEGTGSLLFQNLRTRYGYVYSVDSDISVNHEGAEFSISYASAPKDVNRAGSAAVAIIKRLQQTPLAIEDVQRAKALLLAQRALPLDSYAGLANLMLSNVGYYDDGSDGRFWKALVQTTPAQIQHAMRRIDADHFLRVIVAPE